MNYCKYNCLTDRRSRLCRGLPISNEIHVDLQRIYLLISFLNLQDDAHRVPYSELHNKAVLPTNVSKSTSFNEQTETS